MAMNPGISYDQCKDIWFKDIEPTVNLSAVQESVSNLNRRGRDKVSQIASLLRAITCLDLTTLSGDDTCSNVQRLCFKAESPLKDDIIKYFGLETPGRVQTCLRYPNLQGCPPVARTHDERAGQKVAVFGSVSHWSEQPPGRPRTDYHSVCHWNSRKTPNSVLVI